MTDPNDPDPRCREGRFAKALRVYDAMRTWIDRILSVPRGIVAIVAIVGMGIAGWQYFDEGSVTVDFNTLQRCARGSLGGLKDSTALPSSLTLKSGAAEMSICDGESLTARESEFPAELAAKYPGCLRLAEEGGELFMQLNSEAVCKDSSANGARYLCDGADSAARSPPQKSTLVASTIHLADCTDQFFEDTSRPS